MTQPLTVRRGENQPDTTFEKEVFREADQLMYPCKKAKKTERNKSLRFFHLMPQRVSQPAHLH